MLYLKQDKNEMLVEGASSAWSRLAEHWRRVQPRFGFHFRAQLLLLANPGGRHFLVMTVRVKASR
jgi:hypothetical protein